MSWVRRSLVVKMHSRFGIQRASDQRRGLSTRSCFAIHALQLQPRLSEVFFSGLGREPLKLNHTQLRGRIHTVEVCPPGPLHPSSMRGPDMENACSAAALAKMAPRESTPVGLSGSALIHAHASVHASMLITLLPHYHASILEYMSCACTHRQVCMCMHCRVDALSHPSRLKLLTECLNASHALMCL